MSEVEPTSRTPYQQVGRQSGYSQPSQPQPVYGQPQYVPVTSGSQPPAHAGWQQQQPAQGWKEETPGEPGPDTSGRFQYAAGEWRDKIWAVIFFLHLIVMFILAGVYGPKLLNDLDKDGNNNGSQPEENNDLSASDERNLLTIFALSALFGGLAGFGWLTVMKIYAATIIKISIIVNTVFLGVGAIILFAGGAVLLGVIYLLLAILSFVWYYLVRHRIPFAQATLDAASSSIQEHSGPIYVTYLMAALQILWMAFWGFTFTAVYHNSLVRSGDAAGDSGSTPSGGANGISYFLLLVSLYWTGQVLKNIAHVTTAGVVASWWLNPHDPSPTKGAFIRACTTSLGSICLGSLIVAVLEATRVIVRQARDSAQRNRNAAAACMLCCAECLLGIIENLIRYFNLYAYTQVAIYGKDFVTAAKDTWELFKARGFDAIINDDLTGMVLTFGCFIGAVVTGLFGALWAAALLGGGFPVVVGLIAFILGFIMVALTMTVIQSAVATTFVVWAEDPSTLSQTRPEHFNKLRNAAAAMYPNRNDL